MKRFSFWIIISVFTFLFGIGAVLTWLYYDQKQIVEVEPVPLFDNSCLQSKSFPGLSQKISEIQKGKDERLMNYFEEQTLLDITNQETEVYRFIWLRTFHHPILVGIKRNGTTINLVSKELDGRSGYGFGVPFRKVNITLDASQWCNFLSLLEKSEFWKMPTKDKIIGNDGASWIIEGVKDGRYHIVNRWSPENGDYREACIYLLNLSGVDTDKLGDELY